MNNRRIFSLGFSFVLCLVVLLALLTAVDNPIRARDSTLYVAPGGDCGGASPCYATIQSAVDVASSGDTVKVAQGVYTAIGFQVVYISKAITLTGGYTTTDWANSLPITRPTVIDAENMARRRGVYIDGTSVPTITLDGLVIQRGYAQDSNGGGVFARNAMVVLRNSVILGNRATVAHPNGKGGGVYLESGRLDLSSNAFTSNWAGYGGGGVFVEDGLLVSIGNSFETNSGGGGGGIWIDFGAVAIMRENTFQDNTVEQSGGGVRVVGGTATLEHNEFAGNTATWGGGMMNSNDGMSTLSNNSFHDNAATWGGGVLVHDDWVVLNGNTISGNIASEQGGGLFVESGIANLSGNTIRGNTANAYGGGIGMNGGSIDAQNDIIVENVSTWEGIYLSGGSLSAYHWTLARNGHYALTTNGGSALLINTIVASHSIGGLVGADVWADHTLFSDSGTPCSGGAVCMGSIFGDPHFVDLLAGDYHIGPGSAAVDRGMDSGIITDIDGDTRPLCSGYDIGADELVPPLPTASFATSTPDWLGHSTVFSNTTVVTSCAEYLWSFGDGIVSTAVSPTHAYTASGTYQVTLTATNVSGTSAATETVDIYAASFTSSSPDWLGQLTYFTNTTVTSGTTTYLWSFGDGITDTMDDPSHTYVLPGSYTAVLSASNAAGFGVTTDTITVYSAPTAGFTAHPPQGIRPLTVAFTDTTMTFPAGDLTLGYSWRFGDGQTSALPNPEHAYIAAGVFTVTLAVQNAAGSDTLTRSSYITVYEPVTPVFIGSPTSGIAPLMVAFTNQSSGDYDTCAWSFGDGGTSGNCHNPTHTYSVPGVYTAALTVGGLGGTGTLTRTDYIAVYEPVNAGFVGSPTSGFAPLAVSFTNQSSGGYTASLWDLGDGMTSTMQSPDHVYTVPGVYTVTLVVGGPGGSDSETKEGYITVERRYRVYLPLIVRDHHSDGTPTPTKTPTPTSTSTPTSTPTNTPTPTPTNTPTETPTPTPDVGWSTPIPISQYTGANGGAGVSSRQAAAFDAASNLHVLFSEYHAENGAGGNDDVFWTSNIPGAGWTEPLGISDVLPGQSTGRPSLLAYEPVTLRAVWPLTIWNVGIDWQHGSRADGRPWDSPSAMHTATGDEVLAGFVGQDGGLTPYLLASSSVSPTLIWRGVNATGTQQVFWSQQQPDGFWNDPADLSNCVPGVDAITSPGITVDSQGFVHAVWGADTGPYC